MGLKEEKAALEAKVQRQELAMDKLQDTISGLVEELRQLRAELSGNGKPAQRQTGSVSKQVSFFRIESEKVGTGSYNSNNPSTPCPTQRAPIPESEFEGRLSIL